MATLFHGWQNTNELRNYPFVDGATRDSISGSKLPEDIISDIYISYPKSVGGDLYLASVAVTPNLVTVTIAAAGAPSVPIAVFSNAKPVQAGINYSLEAQYPGVGGWITFGVGINESTFTMAFTEEGTAFLPRLTKDYDDLPLIAAGKVNSGVALTGIVTLVAGRDIQIIAATEEPFHSEPDYTVFPKQQRKIQGAFKKAIVIRLESALNSYQRLFDYAGPCAGNLDSSTCPKQVISSINGVEPDCFGDIEIEVVGDIPHSGLVGLKGGLSGVIFQYPLGLSDICHRDPTLGYKELEDLCEEEEVDPGGEDPGGEDPGGEDPGGEDPAYPYPVPACEIQEYPHVVEIFASTDMSCWVPSDTNEWYPSLMGYVCDPIFILSNITYSYLLESYSHNYYCYSSVYPAAAEGTYNRGGLLIGFNSVQDFVYIEVNPETDLVCVYQKVGNTLILRGQVNKNVTQAGWNILAAHVTTSGGGSVVSVWLNNLPGVNTPDLVVGGIYVPEGEVGFMSRGSLYYFNKLVLTPNPLPSYTLPIV